MEMWLFAIITSVNSSVRVNGLTLQNVEVNFWLLPEIEHTFYTKYCCALLQ